MLVFGNVIAIDEKLPRVRLRIPDMDNYETPNWIFVPQACTVKDKSYNLPAINTLVAAVMDDEMQDGCIIGALYNDEDVCILGNENLKYIAFADGGLIKYNKTESILEIAVPSEIDITVPKLTVYGDIYCKGDIYDKKSSIQAVRDIYNSHTHKCPDGTTSIAEEQMGATHVDIGNGY